MIDGEKVGLSEFSGLPANGLAVAPGIELRSADLRELLATEVGAGVAIDVVDGSRSAVRSCSSADLSCIFAVDPAGDSFEDTEKRSLLLRRPAPCSERGWAVVELGFSV